MDNEQSLRLRHLAEEIIEEILSRLPVKSLLKFRCVSKSWRLLIGTKRFISKHLRNSAHRGIIFVCVKYQNSIIKRYSSSSLLSDDHVFASDDSINSEAKQSIRLVGCCNGLVCILVDIKRLMLWNPSTRVSQELPLFDDELKFSNLRSYGFGWDELSDDYKVFVVISVPNQFKVMCKVYSSKTNSWKASKDNVYNYSLPRGGGKFASGKLHWKRNHAKLASEIVSFDLQKEEYGMIEQPACFLEGCFFELEVIEGRLCCLYHDHSTCVDVWVMKQYGVSDSWEKVVTVYNVRPWFSTEIHIGLNTRIYNMSMMVYYPNRGWGHFCINELDGYVTQPQIYVESLLSPSSLLSD